VVACRAACNLRHGLVWSVRLSIVGVECGDQKDVVEVNIFLFKYITITKGPSIIAPCPI